MRHKYKGRKLGTSHGHTKAIKVGLVQALFLNDRIKTTETRAKEIRGSVDHVITLAKRGDLHSRRLAISALGNNSELAREVFEKVAQGMFKDRPGGYTRIMKLGPRKGDGARMVIMELVTENCVPKAARKSSAAKATPKKATPKKKAATEDDAKDETILDRIEETIEAAEEEMSANIREEGEEQLAEEKAEAKAEDEAAAESDTKAEKAEEEAVEAEAEFAKKAEKAEKEKAEAKEEVVEEEAKAEEAEAKDEEAEKAQEKKE